MKGDSQDRPRRLAALTEAFAGFGGSLRADASRGLFREWLSHRLGATHTLFRVTCLSITLTNPFHKAESNECTFLTAMCSGVYLLTCRITSLETRTRKSNPSSSEDFTIKTSKQKDSHQLGRAVHCAIQEKPTLGASHARSPCVQHPEKLREEPQSVMLVMR